MRGDGKKKENNRRRSLNKPMKSNKSMKSRDVPLPKTLPADLKPYDTNNDGVLDAKERRSMELQKRKEELINKEREDRREQNRQKMRGRRGF